MWGAIKIGLQTKPLGGFMGGLVFWGGKPAGGMYPNYWGHWTQKGCGSLGAFQFGAGQTFIYCAAENFFLCAEAPEIL